MAQYEYQFLTEGSGSFINDTAAEAINNHALCYFDPTGNGWLLADADAAASMPVVGLSMAAIPLNRKGRFLLKGFIGDATWTWTPNGIIYASTTAGVLTQTPPAGAGDVVQAVGIARTATIIWFDPAGFGAVGSGQEFSPETAIVGFNGNLSSAPNYFLADGVADEVEINQAIAYVGALGGGSVFLERGLYTLAGSVTMNQNEVDLVGQGWDSFIDGGIFGDAILITGNDCSVRNLKVQTTAGGGQNIEAIQTSGTDTRIIGVYVSGSDRHGIWIANAVAQIQNCLIDNCDSSGFFLVEEAIISGCTITNSGDNAVTVSGTGDNSVIDGNYIDTTGDDGISIDSSAENCIVNSNRILNWTNQPIDDDSQSSVVQGNNAGGDVLNSNGSGFATIQDAIDDLVAGGWVEVPERTFSESVTISNDDVLLRGRGWDSVIDGGTTGHALDVNGARCTIRDLQVKTTVGQGNSYTGIDIAGANCRVENVFVNGADKDCIRVGGGSNTIVSNCYLYDADENGIFNNGASDIITDNIIEQSGTFGIFIQSDGDDSVISNNVIETTGNDGIGVSATAENCVISDNRISDWTGEPIDDDSDTSVVADNNCGGDVMNSKGCSFATVQASIDHLAGDGWVEVPDGTFAEALVIDENNVLLRGRGWGSFIQGGTTGTAITVSGDSCIIKDLSVSTSPGQGNAYNGITVSGGFNTRITNIKVNGSDQHGIDVSGASETTVLEKSIIFNTDNVGIQINTPDCIVSDCYLNDCDSFGVEVNSSGDRSVINGNIINDTADDGVYIVSDAENCVVSSNQINNWTNEAIDDDSGTSSIGNDNWAGAGTYETQAGGAWVAPTVTAGGVWEGRMIQVYNSNLGQYRTYVYLNAGWRYVALT